MQSTIATVLNYDNHGSCWGNDTVSETQDQIACAAANGQTVHRWDVTDRDGCPLRIVRIWDPTFLDTISVIPA